ncbi:hypothetical protein DVH24_027509 [Malus domestica]|uniref:Uncharacterized protein n=1 Tax=Malus domestica TaxID=3750 RepID=A0A498KU15_MALDO|nr:hypothetical protein DVH24_027509 [Malus domestica]
MFDPDEREEIFVKWNQIYLNVPAILYFLEKGAQPTGTVHDISKRAGYAIKLSVVRGQMLENSFIMDNAMKKLDTLVPIIPLIGSLAK